MMKRYLILLALMTILVTIFLVVPVSAGLNITDGAKITSPYGATSPVITITGSDFPAGDTITIDVPNLYMLVYHGAFTDANVVVNDTASAASWTGAVSGAGDLITLTSAGGSTSSGENITITFTGGGGNPWLPGTTTTYGNLSLPLAVTRTDTSETAIISFMIETPTPPPGGLTITDGSKIITPDGATSPVITIADSDIPAGGTITIQVTDLHFFVNNGTFTEANIAISDNASAADWTGTVSGAGDLITLTSTGGTTSAGENITITFTGGGGNPWLPDTSSRFGDVVLPLTVTRTDTFQTVSLNFMINTTPLPGGLSLADGAKITSTLGATSPIITIAGSNMSRGGTITIDIAGLNPYVANGTLTDDNMVINDTAAHAIWTGLVAGNILTLTSTGSNTTIGENVTVTFTGAGGNPWIPNTQGIQTIPLTVFRTDTSQTGMFHFIIETAPPAGLAAVANFTASPTSDTAPLAVTFTDTSLGSPTMWSWDFGDGSTSTSQNPDHTYLNAGMYTVSLNVTNMYGSDTKTQWNYIRVLVGAVREDRTSIPGLTIDNCAGPQMVTVNTSILTAALVQNNFVLEIQPPVESGFKNITISAMNRQGFARNGNLIFGNPTSIHLVTDDLAPSPGFSSDIGTNSSFNYSIDLPSYPCNAILITKIWGGVISEYDNKLRRIVDGNNASVVGTAYTAKITRTNFPSDARVELHMSVNSSWNPSLRGGPGMMFIWRIADDGNSGQILPTKYLSSDPVHNLDYYEADSPHGLSTFGLSSFTGNNNPFQLITFVIAEVINPKNGGGGSSSGSQTTVPPEIKPSTAPDSGKTIKIYANMEGVITQETILKSTDGLANVSLGRGIVARNSSGKPLSMLSIIRIPAEDIPAGSPGAGLSFTGIAYELQPDGATFYPSIPLSFTIPQAQWGEEYVIQEYDNGTGTWEALPGSYNPQTGIISAQIFHLCSFALFTKPMTIEKTESPTPNTVAGVSEPAISTDVGMYGWIVRSTLDKPQIFVIAAALIAVVACVVWWRRRL